MDRFVLIARANAEAKYRRKRGQMCRKNVGKKIDRFVLGFLLGINPVYSKEVVFLEKPRWGCTFTGVNP